jgi:hypothetical protein
MPDTAMAVESLALAKGKGRAHSVDRESSRPPHKPSTITQWPSPYATGFRPTSRSVTGVLRRQGIVVTPR